LYISFVRASFLASLQAEFDAAGVLNLTASTGDCVELSYLKVGW
jgi:hypothetical protein